LSNGSEVVTGADRAPVTTSLPLLVSSDQKARGFGNGMDNGLFLPHRTANKGESASAGLSWRVRRVRILLVGTLPSP